MNGVGSHAQSTSYTAGTGCYLKLTGPLSTQKKKTGGGQIYEHTSMIRKQYNFIYDIIWLKTFKKQKGMCP